MQININNMASIYCRYLLRYYVTKLRVSVRWSVGCSGICVRHVWK